MVEGEFQRNVLRVDSRKGTASVCRVCAAVIKCVNLLLIAFCSCVLYFAFNRYGLPVNFQAILLQPNKKSTKRLRDVLNQLYSHLDGSAAAPSGNVDVSVMQRYIP